MIRRTSKHNIKKISNDIKVQQIEDLFEPYKLCVNSYLYMIHHKELPLKNNLSSKLIPILTFEPARFRQMMYKKASEIYRSQLALSKDSRFKAYQKVYAYYKKNHPNHKFLDLRYSELNLKDVTRSIYFHLPDLKNITIDLDERYVDIQEVDGEFDYFLKINLPIFQENKKRCKTVNIPLKHYRRSLDLKKNFDLCKSISIKQSNGHLFINLNWKKDKVEVSGNKEIAIDLGVNKLISTSEGDFLGQDFKVLNDKIHRAKRNSKRYKKLLKERDYYVDHVVKQINFNQLSRIYLEDLNDMKRGKSRNRGRSFRRKISSWVYPRIIKRIEENAELQGTIVEKVFPEYSSQTCSCCGTVNKLSRNGETFNCISCGVTIDSDTNGSLVIKQRGSYMVLHAPKVKSYKELPSHSIILGELGHFS